MRGADRSDGTRTSGWIHALGRILLFLALFLSLAFAGTVLLPPPSELTSLALVTQSAILLFAAVAAGGFVLMRLDRRPLGALGFAWTSATVRELWLGLAIGAGAIGVAFAALLGTGSVRFSAQSGTTFDWAIAVGERSARDFGLSTASVPSGAGHDAQEIAQLAPMGMIFVPSVGGISHSPEEFSTPESIAAGADVLLRALLALDRA